MAGPGRGPGRGAAAQRPAPPRLPPRRVRLHRLVQVRPQVRAGPLRPAADPARSAGSRRRPGPRPRATGASSAASTSATPTGRRRVYAFVMVLSHSRKDAVVWSRSIDQLAWHHVHNEAYRRLGGVAAVNRIDNLKTGIARGCGAWGVINEQYRVYARTMGFHVDACEVRCPEQKGKTERRVGDWKRPGRRGRHFDGLAGLQAWTDALTGPPARERRICPATGLSVADELGGGEAAPAAAAGAAARAVRPGQDGAGAQGLHGPFRGTQLCRPVPLRRPRGGGPRLLGTRADRSTRRPPRSWSRTRGTRRADPDRPGLLRRPRHRRRCCRPSRWGGWPGSSRRSPRMPVQRGRWTSTPRWRRWPDEPRPIATGARAAAALPAEAAGGRPDGAAGPARRSWAWTSPPRRCRRC